MIAAEDRTVLLDPPAEYCGRPVTWLRSKSVFHLMANLQMPELKQLAFSCEIRIREDQEDGGYIGHVAQLAGVYGQGETSEKAKVDTLAALYAALSGYVEEDMPIPWREAEHKKAGETSVQSVVLVDG